MMRGMFRRTVIPAQAGIQILLLCSSLSFAFSPGDFYADGNPKSNAIALTFDDGPGKFTEQVLDVLDRFKVQATFFMNGDQAEIRPRIAQEVFKRGHEIGEHTYSHMNFYRYEKTHSSDETDHKIRDEIRKSQAIIEKATGVRPNICRMPYGYNLSRMKGISKEFGLILVNWTFGEDWNKIPEDRMAEDYIQHLRPGTILLFHDGGKDRSRTVAALPKVIEAAQKKGLFFLKISQIISP